MKIQTGKIDRAQNVIVYGPEGVGKSELASELDTPIFIDVEKGSGHLDVPRIEVDTMAEVDAAVKYLSGPAGDPYKTVVVDTLDWVERRGAEEIVAEAEKTSLEDFGFGKGSVMLAERMMRFLLSLKALRAKGKHVVLLAHSHIKKFEAPDAPAGYDRYELKLDKKVAPLAKEFCDALLLLNFVTKTTKDAEKKVRAIGGKERAIFTERCAAYDAKNRHKLPEKISLGDLGTNGARLSAIFTPVASASKPPATAPTTVDVGDVIDKLSPVLTPHEDAVNAFLIKGKQIKSGSTWRDAPNAYLMRIQSNTTAFIAAL